MRFFGISVPLDKLALMGETFCILVGEQAQLLCCTQSLKANSLFFFSVKKNCCLDFLMGSVFMSVFITRGN